MYYDVTENCNVKLVERRNKCSYFYTDILHDTMEIQFILCVETDPAVNLLGNLKYCKKQQTCLQVLILPKASAALMLLINKQNTNITSTSL